MTLNEFVRMAAESCINGSSGEPIRSGEVVAAELRSRSVRDVNQPCTDSIEIGSLKRLCQRCGEWALVDSDGWCDTCNLSDPAFAEEVQKRQEASTREANRLTDAKVAAYLRRMSEDPSYSAQSRKFLRERAEFHDRLQEERDKRYAALDLAERKGDAA